MEYCFLGSVLTGLYLYLGNIISSGKTQNGMDVLSTAFDNGADFVFIFEYYESLLSDKL